MRIAGACLVIVAVIVAITLMRMQNEPLSAPWIAEKAVASVQTLLGPDAGVEIGGSSVFWRGGTEFTVSLSDLKFATGNDISGISRKLDVVVSVNPLAGQLASVREIRIVEPDIVLPWPPPLPAPRSPWPMPVGPLDGVNRILDSVIEDHGSELFDNLEIVRGKLGWRAEANANPQPWLENVAGLASITDGGDVISVVLTGRTSRDGTFDAALERSPSTAEDGGHAMSVSVKGFEFPFSRRAAADRKGKFGWVPVDLNGFGDFTADYGIRDVTFSAEMGPGTVPLGTRDSVFLKTAHFELAWLPDDKAFRFNRAHVEFGDSVIDLNGTLKPQGKDPLNPWRFQVSAQDALINPSDVPGAPVILENIIASGAFLPRDRTIKVERFSVLSPQAPIEGVGSFTFLPKGMMISGASNFGRIHANVLKRLWPSFIVGGTRRWMLNNLMDGVLDRARIDVSLGLEMTDGLPETQGGADEAVDLDFAFSGVMMKSFGEMSRVHDGNGSGSMSGRTFAAKIRKAEFMTPDGRTAPATSGRFIIADVFSPQRKGDLSFTVSGENDVVGAIADQKPVRALNRLDLKSSALSGKVTAKVDASFPLTKKISAADVQWVVDADFQKLSSTTSINGRTIEDADVNVVIDPTTVSMTGIATLDGVRANIQLTEPFGDPSVSLNGDLTLTLSDKDRIARGIDLGDVLKGPVAVGVGVLPDGNQEIAVDLTTAVVNIPVFGWTKAKGIQGQAVFLMRSDGKRTILENFKLVAGDAVIEGKIIINGKGRIQTADISKFVIRKGDVARVKVELSGKNRYEIDFTAERFDGRGLIKTIKSQQASSDESAFAEDDFIVSAKAVSLIGFNGETLRDVVGEMTLSKNRIEKLKADAIVGKTGTTQANGQSTDGIETMTVTTSDSGSMLRFLNIYGSVENGNGFLNYTTDAEGRISGHITITDMTMQTTQEISDQLAKTSKNLNVGEEGPVFSVTNRTDSKTSFEKFRATFDKIGSQFTVTEAFIRSPLIGGSFTGTIDLLSNTIALTGTMIPVYGLNNLFGQIPVLGTLMGAGRNGGLVGVTFRINGSTSDPKLQINTASALAPGIFRKIFEFR